MIKMNFVKGKERYQMMSLRFPNPFSVKDFQISDPITHTQWFETMGIGETGETPVSDIDFYNIMKFIKKRSEIDGIEYRLPTYPELEIATKDGKISTIGISWMLTGTSMYVEEQVDGGTRSRLVRLTRSIVNNIPSISHGHFTKSPLIGFCIVCDSN